LERAGRAQRGPLSDDLIDDIERAYQDDLVEPEYIGWADVQEALALGKDQALVRLRGNSHYRLVERTVHP